VQRSRSSAGVARECSRALGQALVSAAFLTVGVAPLASAQQPGAPGASRVSWELPDLAGRPEWRSEGLDALPSGGARQAVLIAADNFAAHPEWRVHFAGTNIERMRTLLAEKAGVAEAALQVLRGQEVNRDALQAAVRSAASRFRGTDNLLLLYFTGHAGVDASGIPMFFTYYTTTNASGGFERVVSRDEVHTWLAEAKADARNRGAEFQVLFIVDACRVPLLAPPGLARITASADWEWYGTREGRFAEAPSGDAASPFTDAIATAADQLTRGGVGEATLQQLETQASRLTRERTRGEQQPELLQPAGLTDSPVILRRQQVVFGLSVVDAITHLPIPGATVLVGASDQAGTAMIRTVPGRLLVRATAPGYLRRSDEIDVGAERTGQILEVPLHPSVLVVTGQISPPRVVSVGLRGSQEASAYFRVRTTSSPDGRFVLHLPESARGAELEIQQSGQVVRAVAVPASTSGFERPRGSSYEGVPVVDVGVVSLPVQSGESEVLYRVASLPGPSVVPLPSAVSDSASRFPPRLSGSIAVDYLNRVVRYARDRQWSLARQNVLEVLRGGMADSVAAQLEGLLAWIAVQEGLRVDPGTAGLERLATAVGRDHPLAELSLRANIVGRNATQLRDAVRSAPVDAAAAAAALDRLASSMVWREARLAAWSDVVRWGNDQAVSSAAMALASLLESRRWFDARALSSRLRAVPGPQSDSLREEVGRTALRGLLEEAIASSAASGDWERTQAIAQAAESEFPRDAALASMTAQVRDEAMPVAARQRYQEAQRTFADGDLAASRQLYGAALEAGANPHYRQMILAQREYIRQQLYIRHLTQGEQAELAGDERGALEEYLRASEYDGRVDTRAGEMVDRRVPANDTLLAAWRDRVAMRVRRPAVLVVNNFPVAVEVWSNDAFLGRGPLECSLPPQEIADIELRRGGWRQAVTVPLVSDQKTTLIVNVPADTLPWPAMRSRAQMADEVLSVTPFRSALPEPRPVPAARKRSTFRWLLSLVGGAAAGSAGYYFGPSLFMCEQGVVAAQSGCVPDQGKAELKGLGIGAAVGLVTGFLSGAWSDHAAYSSAQRRALQYPGRLEQWRSAVSEERERWLDQVLAPVRDREQVRLNSDIQRVRSANTSTVRANERLEALRVNTGAAVVPGTPPPPLCGSTSARPNR
jgi:hypothetical protein